MTTYVASLYGALVAMSVLASVFFVRYWWLSRDRLFLWFAGAFATLGINWLLLLVSGKASENTPYIYAIRLLGFVQILAGIVLKNRRRST